MGRTRERVVEIPVEGSGLHGVYHDGGAGAEWGMVLCDPFAEEKKCAHRVMVEAARHFAAARFSCLHFDYRGCGDSPGWFEEVGPEEWLEDIAAAAGYMRNETGIATVGALGLRLGATLAMQAAERHGVFDFAVLWEPVVRGTSYLKMNLQRSLIKAMMTEREQFAANSVMQRHAEEEVVDFDGYRVTQETREQIGAVDLLAHPPHFARPTLILNLGSREQASGEYRELAESMENAEARAAVQEPFWNRIGLVSAEAALEETALWLAELQAGALGQAGTRSADMQQ